MKRQKGGKVIIPPSTSAASASAAEDLVVVGEYEVFLSFRGADIRYGFVDYLYNDFVSVGVSTFRNNNEFRVGEEIGPELLRAISESKISIPIFSKNYADSKWCLHELTHMVACRANRGQMIYPIFYDMDPSCVQHQRGSYKKAFRNHRKSVDEETIKQWAEALKIVGELKGLELHQETNMREGELVKIVVKEILSKLKKNYKHVPDNLVGMDSHIEKMKRLLNIDSNGVQIIGILGMGGLGKTTIAKVIYNQVCELFECHCFLEDVRENSSSNAIVKLQNQLVSQILKRESKFDDVNQGIDEIKGAIHRKKDLIVLDDVDKKFQIDKLVGNHSWYETGSRIMITTRNEEVLLALEMTCQNEGLHELYKCYKPKLMADNLALQLFSKYAFMRYSPPEGYEDLAIEVIRTAGGLPLVLVTLGSLLFIEKDKVLWQEKLKKLKAMPPLEVLGRLRISYDALDNVQKQIFLDIACIFSGVDKTKPCYMWDDCNFYPCEGVNALIRRSLITVGDDNELWMHDQLRELGMQIICEENWDKPGEWSRLWRYEDASNIVKTHLGTQNVKVLCLHSSDLENFEEIVDFDILVGKDFDKLPNIRYLSIDSDLDGDFKNLLQNLRWLHWQRCPGNCAPTNLHMKNLVVLDLCGSYITDDWGGWSQIKMSKKLKVLDLSNCFDLISAPHLSAFPTLERLELKGCSSLCRLDGLEELESLKYLNALSCGALESLPDLSKLTRLQTLNVKFCEKLTEIQGLDKLESLEILNTSFCKALKRLPNLSNLQKLTRFESSGCEKLVEIQGLDRLASLGHLEIGGCKSLKSLPDLSYLKRLRKLRSGSLKLTELQGLGGLESLEHLNINGWEHIERLSDLSKLRWLRKLEISSCHKLIEIQGLDGLESLELLYLSNCTSIKSILGLSNLERLKNLHISRCKKLVEIRGLEKLISLELLDIRSCESLKRLPDLSNFKKLRTLIGEGLELTEVQGLGGLESLEHLNMNDLVHIERLSDLSKLRWLRDLKISSCYKLVEIQGLDGLESLELLHLSNCTSIKSILGLSNLKRLKNLHISRCKKLIEIKDLDGLESLEILDMYECKSLERLPDLSNLKKLKRLDISVCYMLVEIQGLDGLESLEILNMSECESLKRLPDLSNLKKLKRLDLSFCYMLIKIQSLDRLESLEHLDMRYCKSIEILPDLLNFGMLKHLSLHNCKRLQNVETLRVVVESLESLCASSCETLDLPMLKNLKKLEICYLEELTELQGLEELKFLAWLNVSGCKSIENLPGVSNLANLKVLDVSYCVKLTEIRGLEELKFLTMLRIVGCKSLENLPYLPTTHIQDIYEDEVESSDYLLSDGSDMNLEQKSHNSINRSFHRRLRDISKYRLVDEVSSYVGSMEET